jgi:hypothetical protein
MQTMKVLAPHQPRRHASAAHHAAWRARENVVWYFDRLGEQIAADLKAGRWRHALRGVAIFVSCLPQHRRYAGARAVAPLRRAVRAITTRRLAAS